MTDKLRFTRDGAIARLTIDRPDIGNLLTLGMVREMTAMVAEAGADPAVKAIVLAGNGDDFCKGRDPAAAPEKGPTTALGIRTSLMAPILGWYAAVREAEVPVIAVVQGLANGLGCATAAVCDVTIAADDARFALPEMKGGIAPTLAIFAHIDRIPAKALLWMVYSTERIDAAAAERFGLVSRIAPAAELGDTVSRFLATLEGYDREALATCKRYMWRARGLDIPAASELAGNMLAVMLSSK